MIGPFAMLIDHFAGIMGVHLTAAGKRVIFGIGIELGKKIFNGTQSKGKHEGLVAVIARTPIAFFKSPGHGDLWQFLPVAQYAKFGFAGQDFPAAQQARFTADAANPVIL